MQGLVGKRESQGWGLYGLTLGHNVSLKCMQGPSSNLVNIKSIDLKERILINKVCIHKS